MNRFEFMSAVVDELFTKQRESYLIQRFYCDSNETLVTHNKAICMHKSDNYE